MSLNNSHSEYQNIEEELSVLFERLAAELPPGTARLRKWTEIPGDGVHYALEPLNAKAARIYIHAENGIDLVWFSFERWHNTWGLPIEGMNPSASKPLKSD